MKTSLLMGNTAAAQGALAAGVRVICGYPGTPSSELLETAAASVKELVQTGCISTEEAPHVEWSVNEKAALELAFGASISGARALVTMKQVGLNVAADPLLTIAYLGVKGGLVLFVADDPGPISSQTEQDTRQFAQFAKVPILDAATPEELYTMMSVAFDISERHETPVIVRATTRVCHGSAPVSHSEGHHPHAISGFERNPRWVIFPPLAYRAHSAMPAKFNALIADKEFASFNYQSNTAAGSGGLGIVASGISWAYLQDALEQDERCNEFDVLKIGAPFPFDDNLALAFLEQHEQVLVFEELEPTLERELLRVAGSRHTKVEILGKLTGHTAFAGESSVESILANLQSFMNSSLQSREPSALPSQPLDKELMLARPPVLCAGCPHRASFYAVKKALRGKEATYSGDIGCYTLGNALPLDMVDTCVCMGAGFTVPQGMHWAEPDQVHVGFVGDSTFFASGITGVVNAVYNQAQVTLIILDNSITAMTGSQPHPGTGIRMSFDAQESDAAQAISIPRVLEALGVPFVAQIDPFELDRAVQAVKDAVSSSGVSAVVFKAPCINVSKAQSTPTVLSDTCTQCSVCIDSIGCPALIMDEDRASIRIDDELCYGCDLCIKVCPFDAIVSNNV